MVAAALALALAVVLLTPAHAQEVPRITKEALKAMLDSPDLVLLDVRSPGDYASSSTKITGAVREDPRLAPSWKDKYDKGKTLVLYCA